MHWHRIAMMQSSNVMCKIIPLQVRLFVEENEIGAVKTSREQGSLKLYRRLVISWQI